VKVVGMRPGEKIHEALISNEEMRRTERRDGYFVVRRHACDGFQYAGADGEYSSGNTRLMTKPELRDVLRRERFVD
jgi:UDP-glucose 4-epimerase